MTGLMTRYFTIRVFGSALTYKKLASVFEFEVIQLLNLYIRANPYRSGRFTASGSQFLGFYA
jgi:hypothetical protein